MVDSGDEVQEIHGIDVESLAQIRGRIDARRLDVARSMRDIVDVLEAWEAI